MRIPSIKKCAPFGGAFFIYFRNSSIHSAHAAVSGHSGSGVLFFLFKNERLRCENR